MIIETQNKRLNHIGKTSPPSFVVTKLGGEVFLGKPNPGLSLILFNPVSLILLFPGLA